MQEGIQIFQILPIKCSRGYYFLTGTFAAGLAVAGAV
jgi:hypothetical protein